MSVDAILDAIRALSPAERAELDHRFATERNANTDAPEISPELAQLLDERNAAYEANPDRVYTWDEVVASVKRKK